MAGRRCRRKPAAVRGRPAPDRSARRSSLVLAARATGAGNLTRQYSETEESTMSRSQGTIKWFSEEKGYGFIKREGESDVFVHHTAVEGGGRALQEGDRVEFDVVEDKRGLKAQNVVRLESE